MNKALALKSVFASIIGFAPILISNPSFAEDFIIKSPNGKIELKLEANEKGVNYNLKMNGEEIISSSPIGYKLDKANLGGANLKLVNSSSQNINSSFEMVVGKQKIVKDNYNQTILNLTNTQNGKDYNFQLIARVYDNGAAFRVVIPKQESLTKFSIMAENTRYNFPKNYNCYGLNQGRFENSHEGEYDLIKADKMRNFHLYDYPLVCKTGNKQTTFALAESDVINFPSGYLTGPSSGALGAEVILSPRTDNYAGLRYDIILAKYENETVTAPWRVIMLGEKPTDLAESSLIQTLATPNKIGDTSWIKPGKSAWDWWNGWKVNIPNAGVNTATYKYYIDFAAELGLEYLLIDEGWYKGTSIEPNPNADITTPIPALDMAEIISYAKSKNIDVMVWLQWEHLIPQMDKAFELYEKWGIKGVKIDFMNRSDQEMVKLYHEMLSKAAKHKLLVDLHGAYIPNGLTRTYPNYMTQEGVLGAEYNKWSARITATHNVTLPFTRGITGPMDYTPGGFRNTTPKEFPKLQNFSQPYVMTTRGHGLAMYVVFESPLQMVSDNPEAYKNKNGTWADGVDFIKEVPASWDETKVLQGDIGQYIVTARRKGDKWYIGAMTNEAARSISIPLSFLGNGTYNAEIWQDGLKPTEIKKSRQTISKTGVINLKLAPSGGGTIIISK